MKIIVDENIPLTTVQALRGLGRDVTDLLGTRDEGADDERLWRIAQRTLSLLITTDKGFTNRRFENHRGILVVRLRKPNALKIHDRVMMALAKFSPAEWTGLTVAMRDHVQSVWQRKERP